MGFTGSIGNSQIVFGNTGSNVFRLTEEIYDSSNRAVTSSYYDENKNLINPSTSPINMQWLASTNKFSFVFTQTSISASTAGWDKNFPYNSFPPLTGGIGTGPTANTGKLAYHTVIQSLSNTIYNAVQVQSLKTLLDQIYGV